MGQQLRSLMRIFQSTPSAWRETILPIYMKITALISIHSLRMEGDFLPICIWIVWFISIHSLRMEGDP